MAAIKIKETKNYSMFESNELNRLVKKDSKDYRELRESMKKNGWCVGCPLYVIPGRDGKYIIKMGHHRLAIAMELGIPVKYVVDRSAGIPLRDLEVGKGKWSIGDHFYSHARHGNHDYLVVESFCKVTNIPFMSAISMFSGKTAGGGNVPTCNKIKNGAFSIKDNAHPYIVAEMTELAKGAGFKGATNQNFVIALSKTAKTDGIDLDRLKAKMKAHPYLFKKCPSVDGYLDMLQEIYNRKSSDKTPLAFMANSAARARAIVQPKDAA